MHLTNFIKETCNASTQVDGLGVLIDACYSGAAVSGAGRAWISGLQGMLRFGMLTAAADRPAANGCFSRTLLGLLKVGISAVRTEHLLYSRPFNSEVQRADFWR